MSGVVTNLHLKTPTSLSCYLANLYAIDRVLNDEEAEEYENQAMLAQLGGDPDQPQTEETESEEEPVVEIRPTRTRRNLVHSPDPDSITNPDIDPESRGSLPGITSSTKLTASAELDHVRVFCGECSWKN